jgi:glycerol kinase
MTPDLLLAIDQGTTSTRSVLFSADLVPLAQAQRELSLHYPRPGWVEHDPERIWESVNETIREVLAVTGASI